MNRRDANFEYKAGLGCLACQFVFWLAVVATLAVVAWHFVSKLW